MNSREQFANLPVDIRYFFKTRLNIQSIAGIPDECNKASVFHDAANLCEQFTNFVGIGRCHAPTKARLTTEVDMQLFHNVRSQWIGAGFAGMCSQMSTIGSRVDETGTLIRAGAAFALRRDIGGRWKLDLHRVSVEHVEKRVRISGIVVAEGLVDVDALGPDLATI